MTNSIDDARIRNQNLPVFAIPTEISTGIFKIACSDSSPFKNGGVDLARVEVKISHVSHRWRRQSLACPELWSTFAHDNYSDKICVDRLSVYLKRSGNRLLDLWLVLSKGDLEPSALALLLKILMGHATRWHRISLSLDREGITWPTSNLLPMEPLDAPNLQSFEVHMPYQQSSFPLVFLEGGTPKLDSIRMDSLSFASINLSSQISTLQIENIGGDSHLQMPWSMFLDILRCPNLTNLSLCGEVVQKPTDDDNGQIIVAQRLQHFRCTDTVVACEIWSVLHAPSLELAIFKETPLDGWNFPFTEVATQSTPPDLFPSLRTLVFINCNSDNVDCSQLLAYATNAVTHLYIMHDPYHIYNDNSSVFHHMVQQSPETILWPNLETLSCMVEMNGETLAAGINPTSCLEVVECRSRILQKHCTLRLFDTEMRWWKSSDPKSWTTLRDKGFYQRIAGYCEGDIDYVPWPPRADSPFHRLAELNFLSHNDEI